MRHFLYSNIFFQYRSMERKLSEVSLGNDGTDESSEEVKIRVGICAMNKKVRFRY